MPSDTVIASDPVEVEVVVTELVPCVVGHLTI